MNRIHYALIGATLCIIMLILTGSITWLFVSMLCMVVFGWETGKRVAPMGA